MARRKKHRGAVIQPHGRSIAYDTFLLKQRHGNIVPLPTQQNTRANQVQKGVIDQALQSRLRATPRRTKNKAAIVSNPPTSKLRVMASPLCTAPEIQPMLTSVQSLLFVPVVIDMPVDDAQALHKQLSVSAGITIKTLGLDEKYDLTIQDNGPRKYTITQLIELAFILTNAPYVALLRQEPIGQNWLAGSIQTAMDSRSPVAVIELAPSGLFGDSSLILERSNFITQDTTLKRGFWKIIQRVTLT